MSISPPSPTIPLQPAPSSSPTFATTTLPKRRPDQDILYQADKRRRISSSSRNSSSSALAHSPELRRGGVNFTPRWSREPPSPFTGAGSSLAHGRGGSAEGEDHGILLGRTGSQGAFSAGGIEDRGIGERDRSASWSGRTRAASGTPFAYATPHSGLLDDGNGGDTEVEDGEGSESSWPGWEDGAMEAI
jgi:hypothetical protein